MPEVAKMKPLIFATRSILAWQQGAKTQTRRLVRPQPLEGYVVGQSAQGPWVAATTIETYWRAEDRLRQPYAVGDLLWIREALVRWHDWVAYSADHNYADAARDDPDHHLLARWPLDRWKRDKLPAMFMPRWACRYYAKVVSVRPERLQDITEEDALAEGTLVERDWQPSHYEGGEHDLYLTWWDELHRKPEHKSEANPMVWRYGLEKADAS